MNILLIEDDAFFQKFYSLKLTEKQFKVTSAANGEEGVERAREQAFDVILLDLIMPRVDGFSFLETRKNDPTLSRIPVIVFSTLGQDSDMQKAKSLGANDFVNKSFLDFDGLLVKIQAVIGK